MKWFLFMVPPDSRWVITCIATAMVAISLSAQNPSSAQVVQVSPTANSPGGVVSSTLLVDADSRLRFQASFQGRQIVQPSALGITVDGDDLGDGVIIGQPTKSVINQTYTTRGHHHTAINHCVHWEFPITHSASGIEYAVHLRVYDDGVAYRYVVPGNDIQHVDGEASSWTLPAGLKAWFFERNAKKWKLKSYAGEWLTADIDELPTISPSGPVQGTPMVFELPANQGFMAITKAATYNYSGMRLRAVGKRTLIADFTEAKQGFDVNGTITTPWRVTLFADNLTELATSDLINNLNPSPDPQLFSDTSYIKPGRCVWSWETLGLGTPETQEEFIDLAAELGFEYSLVDDGWKDWNEPWKTAKSLCNRAAQKNVGVWLWVHSQDIIDPTDNYAIMRDYFDRVAAIGAVGLKIDFMNGESKTLIDFETAALKIAAEHKLLINFHGCHSSTGESRTYPNEMTREGVRGIEVNKMKEGPLTASHNAALPFTRFAVGHADYTPILYTNPGPTTLAHQLGTAVAYLSPLQVFAEHPETILHSPDVNQALPVLMAMPTVWDETVVLPNSRIGDLAALARRSGNDWFVAVLNGSKPRKDAICLDFLGDGLHTATCVLDDIHGDRVDVSQIGVNQKADRKQWTHSVPMRVSTKSVRAGDEMNVDLASGGGAVLWVRPSR
ncbi:glycoside hydrolase family 97 protein [Crateriforma spongiae]|uniref:glycoside hydrolase family 97 protein n=1 Tax=Crateriforma spongiae TaxID=2724528 RepID=UPI001F473803|nr:glycoside hydrolase family 97 protein [Crateriforma spongiae]